MVISVPPVHVQSITLELLPTDTVLDETLGLLQEFLNAKLAATELQTLIADDLNIAIEIGFLGLRHTDASGRQKWVQRVVYPVRILHSSVLFGPLSVPGEPGCPYCLERRWLANRPYEEQHALDTLQNVRVPAPHPRFLPPVLETLWSIVEVDLQRHLARLSVAQPQDGQLGRTFYELQLDALKITPYQLLADSDCPLCRHPVLDEPIAEPFELSSHVKSAVNSYRLTSPLDYTLPEKGYINPVSGMLGSGAITVLNHTVTAMVRGNWQLKGEDRGILVGWGGHHTRLDVSERVGILEGLERYCGHWPRTKPPVYLESYQTLADDALDLSTCGLYLPAIYQRYKNQLAPYSPDLKMSWVWGYSYRQARPLLVPEQLAFYAGGNQRLRQSVWDTSNGCAIGSCMEEAVLHGLMELIERDGFLLSWYARLAAPRIDPWSSHARETLHVLDRIDHLDFDVHVLDTRFDLTIPNVTVVVQRRDNELGQLMVGAAASLDPEAAIRSALREVAAYIPDMRERVESKKDAIAEMIADYQKVQKLEHHPLLYGFPEMAQKAHFLLQNACLKTVDETYAQWYREMPRQLDLRADLQYCLNLISQLGMDVIVVDQTAPELAGTGLKVVKVIVPGLIPIDFGWGRNRVFGLSRLSTLPRTCGYTTEDFDLAQLNLDPHPFP